MKKLLLCTLIMAFGLATNLANAAKGGQAISSNNPKTPTLNALRKKQIALIEKIDQLKPQSKETEEINQELKNINKKFEEINEKPELQEYTNQIIKLMKQMNEEFKKIQNSKELKEVKAKSKDEISKLMKEITQTDPKIKTKIDQLKELVDQVKEITKNKYSEEFKQIESYNPANLSDTEENNFNKIVKNLAQKDEQIKKLKNNIGDVSWKMVIELFANKQYQETGKNLATKENAIKYKLNPEIKKIDKKLDSLNKECELLMENLLIEINKKEATQKP